MPIFFEGNRGRVVRLDDPAAQATLGFVKVADAPIRYASQLAIITRLTISQQANVQFLHTLGQAIYIYVFGDRIGQVGLSGLAFNQSCDVADGGGLGIERMLAWYATYRVSRRGAPVRVMVGNTPIEGFVTGATHDTVDAETGLVQWGITLMALPEAQAGADKFGLTTTVGAPDKDKDKDNVPDNVDNIISVPPGPNDSENQPFAF